MQHRYLQQALALAICVPACSSVEPMMAVAGFAPGTVPAGELTDLTVLGHGFHARVTVNLDDPDRSTADREFTVILRSGTQETSYDASLEDAHTLRARVGPLEPGSYAVWVRSPQQLQAHAPGELRVVRGNGAGDHDLGDGGGRGDTAPGDVLLGDAVTGDAFTGDAGGDPGLGDPGLGDPGLGDPGLGDAGLGDPGLGDPGFGDPGHGDPGFGDPGLGDPGLGDPIPAALYRDDFSGGLNLIESVGGHWSHESGELRASQACFYDRAAVPGESWLDARASVRFRIVETCGVFSSAESAALTLRTSSDLSCVGFTGYMCRAEIDPGHLGIYRSEQDCLGAELSTASLPAPLTLGAWHILEVSVVGGEITCTVSGGDMTGAVSISAVDPAPLGPGTVGLLTGTGTSQAYFDDLEVTVP